MSSSFTEGLSSFFSSYGLLIVLMVAMFAIMIIPQRRRDKKVKDMLASLKVGTRVRTIGGIYGTIATSVFRTRPPHGQRVKIPECFLNNSSKVIKTLLRVRPFNSILISGTGRLYGPAACSRSTLRPYRSSGKDPR